MLTTCLPPTFAQGLYCHIFEVLTRAFMESANGDQVLFNFRWSSRIKGNNTPISWMRNHRHLTNLTLQGERGRTVVGLLRAGGHCCSCGWTYQTWSLEFHLQTLEWGMKRGRRVACPSRRVSSERWLRAVVIGSQHSLNQGFPFLRGWSRSSLAKYLGCRVSTVPTFALSLWRSALCRRCRRRTL
jgi:hypothetical protein